MGTSSIITGYTSSILRHVTLREYSSDGSCQRKMKAFCFAVLLLLVGGCASVEWSKAGSNVDERAADTRQCQQNAWCAATWQVLDRTYPSVGCWAYPCPLVRQ